MEKHIFENKAILQKLIVKNFRGFRDLEVDFDSNLTIFIGVNGSGKSTIIHALAKNLRYLANKIKSTADQGKRIPAKELFTKNDINVLAKSQDLFCEIDLYISTYYEREKESIDYNEEVVPIFMDSKKQYLKNTVKINDELKIGLKIKYSDRDYKEETSESVVEFAQNVRKQLENSNLFGLPLFLYYPCEKSDNKEKSSDSNPFIIFNAYDNAMTGNAIDYQGFVEWYKWCHAKQQQTKQEDKILKDISQAILDLLNDNGNVAYNEIGVFYDDYPAELYFQKGESRLLEPMLSSGEKTMIAIVADLARRLVIANPHSNQPLHGQGIVLIDEIDLHLHPSWQRKVVTKLREIFPNIQFVITTHSATLISYIDKKHLRILKDGKIAEAPYVKGRDINSISKDVFEISERPEEYIKKIESFYNVLEKNVEEAKRILTELREDYGEIDSEIIRAESYLEIY